MSDQPTPSGAQFRADRPVEQEAVRTTIVGGRPPGSGQKVGPIPRGIEVLLRKASVDVDFKDLLLRDRAAAAETIGLKLEPGEVMMLSAAPAAQLEAVIARTSVPQEHRRAFLGHAAAAMLAAMASATSVVAAEVRMEAPGGIRVPPKKEKTTEEKVIGLIADRTGVEAKRIQRDNSLVDDLNAKPADLATLREDLEKQFAIKVPAAEFQKIGTVGETVDYVEKALKKKAMPKSPPVSRGVRPDRPPIATDGGTRPN
jgi:acyl carrier protein